MTDRIDIERLGVLLDRGDDVQADARLAEKALQDAEKALRENPAQRARLAMQAAEKVLHQHPNNGKAFDDLQDAKHEMNKLARDDAAIPSLVARIDRRRAAHTELARRANLWLDYCDALRALAKKHGVVL